MLLARLRIPASATESAAAAEAAGCISLSQWHYMVLTDLPPTTAQLLFAGSSSTSNVTHL